MVEHPAVEHPLHTGGVTGPGQVGGPTSARVAGPMVTGDTVATMRFCNAQVVMQGGRVTRLNYTGPSGGFLAPGEQCAFAVRNCVRPSAAPGRWRHFTGR